MTFLEMQQELASRLRLDMNQSDQVTLIKRWLNQSQYEIWARHDWPWALDREIVQTVVDKTDGTVSIDAGGQTVTGVSTAFASGDVGKFIQFSSSNDWYKVSTFSGTTSIAIEAPYVGTSALSAGTYTLRKVFYNVSSSVEKILSIRQTISPVKLTLVPYREYDLWKPNQEATSNPQIYVPWGFDSSNRWTFSLDPFPSDVLNLEVRFKKEATELSADGDETTIPNKWQHVLIEGALYRGLEAARTSHEDKRAEFKQSSFEKQLGQMIAEAEPNSDNHHVIANRDVAFAARLPRLPEDFGPRR